MQGDVSDAVTNQNGITQHAEGCGDTGYDDFLNSRELEWDSFADGGYDSLCHDDVLDEFHWLDIDLLEPPMQLSYGVEIKRSKFDPVRHNTCSNSSSSLENPYKIAYCDGVDDYQSCNSTDYLSCSSSNSDTKLDKVQGLKYEPNEAETKRVHLQFSSVTVNIDITVSKRNNKNEYQLTTDKVKSLPQTEEKRRECEKWLEQQSENDYGSFGDNEVNGKAKPFTRKEQGKICLKGSEGYSFNSMIPLPYSMWKDCKSSSSTSVSVPSSLSSELLDIPAISYQPNNQEQYVLTSITPSCSFENTAPVVANDIKSIPNIEDDSGYIDDVPWETHEALPRSPRSPKRLEEIDKESKKVTNITKKMHKEEYLVVTIDNKTKTIDKKSVANELTNEDDIGTKDERISWSDNRSIERRGSTFDCDKLKNQFSWLTIYKSERDLSIKESASSDFNETLDQVDGMKTFDESEKIEKINLIDSDPSHIKEESLYSRFFGKVYNFFVGGESEQEKSNIKNLVKEENNADKCNVASASVKQPANNKTKNNRYFAMTREFVKNIIYMSENEILKEYSKIQRRNRGYKMTQKQTKKENRSYFTKLVDDSHLLYLGNITSESDSSRNDAEYESKVIESSMVYKGVQSSSYNPRNKTKFQDTKPTSVPSKTRSISAKPKRAPQKISNVSAKPGNSSARPPSSSPKPNNASTKLPSASRRSTNGSQKQTSSATRSTSAYPKPTSESPKSTSASPKATSESSRATSASQKSSSASPRSKITTPKSSSAYQKPTSASSRSTNASPRSTSASTRATSASTRSTSESPRSTSASLRLTSTSKRSTSASNRSTGASSKLTSESPNSTSAYSRSTSASKRSTSASPKSTSVSPRLTNASNKSTSASPRSNSSSPRSTSASQKSINASSKSTKQTNTSSCQKQLSNKGTYQQQTCSNKTSGRRGNKRANYSTNLGQLSKAIANYTVTRCENQMILKYWRLHNRLAGKYNTMNPIPKGKIIQKNTKSTKASNQQKRSLRTEFVRTLLNQVSVKAKKELMLEYWRMWNQKHGNNNRKATLVNKGEKSHKAVTYKTKHVRTTGTRAGETLKPGKQDVKKVKTASSPVKKKVSGNKKQSVSSGSKQNRKSLSNDRTEDTRNKPFDKRSLFVAEISKAMASYTVTRCENHMILEYWRLRNRLTSRKPEKSNKVNKMNIEKKNQCQKGRSKTVGPKKKSLQSEPVRELLKRVTIKARKELMLEFWRNWNLKRATNRSKRTKTSISKDKPSKNSCNTPMKPETGGESIVLKFEKVSTADEQLASKKSKLPTPFNAKDSRCHIIATKGLSSWAVYQGGKEITFEYWRKWNKLQLQRLSKLPVRKHLNRSKDSNAIMSLSIKRLVGFAMHQSMKECILKYWQNWNKTRACINRNKKSRIPVRKDNIRNKTTESNKSNQKEVKASYVDTLLLKQLAKSVVRKSIDAARRTMAQQYLQKQYSKEKKVQEKHVHFRSRGEKAIFSSGTAPDSKTNIVIKFGEDHIKVRKIKKYPETNSDKEQLPVGKPKLATHSLREPSDRNQLPVGKPTNQTHSLREPSTRKQLPVGKPTNQTHSLREPSDRKQLPVGKPTNQTNSLMGQSAQKQRPGGKAKISTTEGARIHLRLEKKEDKPREQYLYKNTLKLSSAPRNKIDDIRATKTAKTTRGYSTGIGDMPGQLCVPETPATRDQANIKGGRASIPFAYKVPEKKQRSVVTTTKPPNSGTREHRYKYSAPQTTRKFTGNSTF